MGLNRPSMLGLAMTLVITLGPRTATGAWWDDLEAKADGWKSRIRAALERLEAAADAARDRLDAVAEARIDALLALFREQADALERLRAEEGDAWAAVVSARSEELDALIGATAQDLQGILGGTRDHFSVELDRLGTGTRGLLERAARRAGQRLGEVQMVDGDLVAARLEAATRTTFRLGGMVATVGGALLLLIGLVMLVNHAFIAGGLTGGFGVALGAAGVYLALFVGAARGPSLGRDRCPALVEPAPQLEDLLRCRATAFEAGLAAAVERRIARVRPPS